MEWRDYGAIFTECKKKRDLDVKNVRCVLWVVRGRNLDPRREEHYNHLMTPDQRTQIARVEEALSLLGRSL